jgi:hypothetical protein
MQTGDLRESSHAAKLDHTSAGLVALLTLVTLGLYLPVWYLGRLSKLNGLSSPAKLSRRLAYVLLGLYLLRVSGVMSFIGGSDIQSALLLSGLSNMLMLATGMILVSMRLRVREILHDHYGESFSARPKSSWLASALVGEIYLQAKMNRLPAPAGSEDNVPEARAVIAPAP